VTSQAVRRPPQTGHSQRRPSYGGLPLGSSSRPTDAVRHPASPTLNGNAAGQEGCARGGVPYDPPEKRPGDPPLYGAVPEGSSTESRGVARSLRHLCSRARRLLE
jgi:hypothetical protein